MRAPGVAAVVIISSITRTTPIAAVAVLSATACADRAVLPDHPAKPRLVSLSPSSSEVLFWIGAGDQVAAVSDYCTHPPEATKLPHVGTALTPALETLAGLRPTRIITERVPSANDQGLAAIAPVTSLPWLSTADVVASIRELGRMTDRTDRAELLARRFEEILSKPALADAPRVLLVIGNEPVFTSVWYVKKTSLHGAVLEAAGARNAAAALPDGPPHLSLEGILALDPDIVIVLVNSELDDAGRQRWIDGWARLAPLRASQRSAIRVIAASGVMSTGPRILDLVERLRGELLALRSG